MSLSNSRALSLVSKRTTPGDHYTLTKACSGGHRASNYGRAASIPAPIPRRVFPTMDDSVVVTDRALPEDHRTIVPEAGVNHTGAPLKVRTAPTGHIGPRLRAPPVSRDPAHDRTEKECEIEGRPWHALGNAVIFIKIVLHAGHIGRALHGRLPSSGLPLVSPGKPQNTISIRWNGRITLPGTPAPGGLCYAAERNATSLSRERLTVQEPPWYNPHQSQAGYDEDRHRHCGPASP